MADIICLQETHSCVENEDIWRNLWGGRILFCHGQRNSKGVCILFKRGLFLNITHVKQDLEGRFIACNIDQGDVENQVCICNIYAPNQDSPTFFDMIDQNTVDMAPQKIIIGDFNVVLDDKLDRYGCAAGVNKPKAVKVLKTFMTDGLLADVWRERNNETLRFSWKRHNLVNVNKNERGPGYWKLNASLLQSKPFVDELSDELKKDIAATEEMENPLERWLTIKQRLIITLKKLSRKMANEKALLIAQLKEALSHLSENMPLNSQEMILYENTEADLDKLLEEKARAAAFRCKVNWYEAGEKNTKYFYGLEKMRYNAKTTNKIILEDGEEVTDSERILEEQRAFYAKLYKHDDEVSFTLQNDIEENKLSVEEQERLQQEFTLKEVSEAVLAMKNSKALGIDGLPIEIYKICWKHIASIFYNAIQEEFKVGIHSEAKRGILNLIPKNGKDSRFISNMHPITLLNTEYKIIENCIARRMDSVMDSLIHMDQKGFMRNRRISVNIRKLLDLIRYTDENDLPALIISLDFRKCFDLISFGIIQGSLEYFGFPDYIKTWIQLLYTDFYVQVQNNGHISTKIDIERSVHQGGCMSSYIFLCCAEILAINIRSRKEIKGIPVEEFLFVLNQFADDTDVTSDFSQASLDCLFSELRQFRLQSGFEISYDKTAILRIGSLKDSDAMLYTQPQLTWKNDVINVLGINVPTKQETLMDNYTKTIDGIKALLAPWSKRNLSLLGKVMIINTLIASLFIYKMTVLPNMSEKMLTTLDTYFNEFIWGGKRPKIPLKVLKRSKNEGGAALVDLRARQSAIKTTWIQILQQK